MKKYRLGIDDTDSSFSYCTTYIATLLVEELTKNGYKLLDFPYLIRLNPNIPHKTRGNASVSIKAEFDESFLPHLINFFKKLTASIEDPKRPDKPSPVLAIFAERKNEELQKFYERALVKKVNINEALSIAKKLKIRYVASRGSLRGLIGAIAAIGAELEDFTYELLAYRDPLEKGKIREISYEKVLLMDNMFKDFTFANIDREKKRILITPHGKDPVLVGIRGIDPDKLIEAFNILNPKAEKWLIFKTNQGTDAHLKTAEKLKFLDKYCVFSDLVEILDKPRIIKGGHVILKGIFKDKLVEIAVYRESGTMNKKARLLEKGDIIKVGGSIREVRDDCLRINAEKIEIIKINERFEEIGLHCINCGSKMESIGSGKGLRCPSCKFRINFEVHLLAKLEHTLKEGEILLPPPRSRRHLTKPPELTKKAVQKPFEMKYFFSKELLLKKEKPLVNFLN